MEGRIGSEGGVALVEFEAGVHFRVATGDDGVEADDGISRSLAAGVYPAEYNELFTLIRALAPAGGRVLDLGGHIGSVCLGASAAGFEVVAVEASPRNAALLNRSRELNGFGRLRIVHAAVGERAGTLRFEAFGPYGHVMVDDDAPAPHLVEVRAVAVDDLLAELGWDRVDFIKMDVEGSEVAAVLGMARMLARPDAPAIFYESNGHTLDFFGKTPGDLKEALRSLGYRNYLVKPGRLIAVAPEDFQASTVVDYLAVKGRLPEIPGWTVEDRLERGEVLEDVRATLASTHPFDPVYARRALAQGPEWLRNVPELADISIPIRDGEASLQVAQAARPRRTSRPFSLNGLWALLRSRSA